MSKSIVDSIKIQFPFEVQKHMLRGPDNIETPHYGLFRNDTFESVGNAFRKGYTPHTTEDVIALGEAAESAFDGDVKVECHFRDGHYIHILPSNAERHRVFDSGKDNVFPRVLISAMYDGRAFKANLGLYRDVCRNLHIMRQIEGISVSIRHTSGLRDHMERLIRQFRELRDGWPNLISAVKGMTRTEVNMQEFIRGLYGDVPPNEGRAQTESVNRIEKIMQRVYREQRLLGMPEATPENGWNVNGWIAYNAIQGFVQHDARARGTHAGEFDRIIRASKDAKVGEAERYVLNLASMAA